MDHFLTEFQTNFYIGVLLLFSNFFIHLAKMIEADANPSPTVHQEAIAHHSAELEFDCPGSFNFKDPNVDDFNLDSLFGRLVPKVFLSPASNSRSRAYLIEFT